VIRARALLAALLAGPALPGAAAQDTPPPSPGASAADQRLRRVRERSGALRQELQRLRAQEKSVLGEIERLELEVRLRGEELKEIQIRLQRTNEQMDATLQRARELEESVDRTRPVLAARARALYKLGELSYLRLLLSVERPSDLVRGYRFVSTLARRDRQRLAAFRADLGALAETRSELEAKTREALALRSAVEQARRSLDTERRRKSQLLTSLVERKETQAAYLEELGAAETRLEQLVQGLAEGEVSVPVAAFKGSLPWPVAGRVRTGFGRRKHPRFDTYTLHNGIEIESSFETPVAVVHEGTVVFAERFRGYGLLVVVDHGGKHHSLYAHLAESRVGVGQRLAAGDIVGLVGGSGIDGPGLYFEMRAQGRPEDPLEWLR
jgi:septal ring factor EnvC (AmiA/AmiB activator)